MKIVCLTHGRAGLMTTHRAFGEEVVLSVAESQADEYREAYPELEIDVHPDDVVGLPAKKNFVSQRFGTVFMLDDDVIRVADLATGEKVSPAKACDLIRRLGDQAQEMGAAVFGFSGDANPLHFQPQRPFALTGLIDGGKFGLIEGSGLWWPDDPMYGMCEDMWLCGLNAHRRRFLLKDLRYAFVGPTESQDLPGGLGATRTLRALDQCAEALVAAFGDAVVLKDRSEAAKYNWRLRVPW